MSTATLTENELTQENIEEIKAQVKRIIEALLFSSNEPISLRRIMPIVQTYHPFEKAEIKEIIQELSLEYEEQNRAFRLEEIAKGYLLRTCEEFGPYIHALLKTTRADKLSHAATEVLAIISFRQPITKPEIDEIRGVDSSGIVSTLIDRELIEPVGKKEAPGRPTLYGTTNKFLNHFGLRDIKDLGSSQV